MSYARSPSEGDVYVIATKIKDDARTVWECMSCDLLPAVRVEGHDYEAETGSLIPTGEFYWQPQTFYAYSPGHMVTHLRLHVAAQQKVPERAFTRLQEEEIEWQRAREEEFQAAIKQEESHGKTE